VSSDGPPLAPPAAQPSGSGLGGQVGISRGSHGYPVFLKQLATPCVSTCGKPLSLPFGIAMGTHWAETKRERAALCSEGRGFLDVEPSLLWKIQRGFLWARKGDSRRFGLGSPGTPTWPVFPGELT